MSSLLSRVLEDEFATTGAAGRRYWNEHRARELRKAAGHLGAIRRDPGDAIHDDFDAVGFAAACVFHGPGYPGWPYQATAVRLAKRARDLAELDEALGAPNGANG